MTVTYETIRKTIRSAIPWIKIDKRTNVPSLTPFVFSGVVLPFSIDAGTKNPPHSCVILHWQSPLRLLTSDFMHLRYQLWRLKLFSNSVKGWLNFLSDWHFAPSLFSRPDGYRGCKAIVVKSAIEMRNQDTSLFEAWIIIHDNGQDSEG